MLLVSHIDSPLSVEIVVNNDVSGRTEWDEGGRCHRRGGRPQKANCNQLNRKRECKLQLRAAATGEEGVVRQEASSDG